MRHLFLSYLASRFIGDGTGQFHIRKHQQIYVEYIESENNRTEAPCSYLIDQFGELVLPYEFHVHGVRTEVHGLITGVHHFFVEDNGRVRISSTAQTALLENRTYIDVTQPGNISLANIVVKKGGIFDILRKRDVTIQVTSSLFEIKYEGKVLMNHGVLYTSVGDVETKGELVLDGQGWDSETGIGKGYRHGYYGTGGGHGGRGGTNGGNQGQAYDSVFKPLMLGSGGGAGRYGAGGQGK